MDLKGAAIVGASAFGLWTLLEWVRSRVASADDSGETPSFKVPAANPQVEALYGHIEWEPLPGAPDPQAIRITNGWDKENLVSAPTRIGPVPFNKRGAVQLKELLDAWAGAGLPVSAVQTVNLRRIRPKKPEKPGEITTGLSWHTYGAAVDVNPGELPFGKPAPDGHWIHKAAEIAKGLGWSWGGDFSYPDPMHFQLVSPRGPK